MTVDAEGGYGMEPAELVTALRNAGAAGCNLEDTDNAVGSLRDPDGNAEWIRAVRQAASAEGYGLVINARVDVFLWPFVSGAGPGTQEGLVPDDQPGQAAPVEVEEAHVVHHHPAPDARAEKAQPPRAQGRDEGHAIGDHGQRHQAESGHPGPADLFRGLHRGGLGSAVVRPAALAPRRAAASVRRNARSFLK